MDTIWTNGFWKAAVERAIRAAANTLAGLLIAGGTGLIEEEHWIGHLSVAGMAGLVSILLSVGANAITRQGPSIGKTEVINNH